VPENGAGRVVVNMEQIQFPTQLAVIALFRFFQAMQISC